MNSSADSEVDLGVGAFCFYAILDWMLILE